MQHLVSPEVQMKPMQEMTVEKVRVKRNKRNQETKQTNKISNSFFHKIPFVVCVFIMVAVSYMSTFIEIEIPAWKHQGWFVTTFLVFFGYAVIEMIWRIILVYRYKPMESCEDALLPSCTVIVPAFNEGKQVFETIKSLVASNYPKDKLKIIAVDDGSVDDTWKWIVKAKKMLCESLVTIQQPCNKGKRHALYAGCMRSKEDIIVTVDSDSTVDPDTLRNLVTPFARDEKVGAVAGNVRVLNINKGILPKMLDVVFVFSFDFMRASQSMVKAVMCTPGALSAYKRSVVMKVLHEWLNQTFCGRPANIGEDRAMTNLILREGYFVLFQQNAKVYTEVPLKYVNLCKMYLRWARSNVREIIAMTKFIFKPFRTESKLGARINLISGWLALTKGTVCLFLLWGLIAWHPISYGGNTLCAVIFSSGLAALIYAWKFSSFAALWSFVYGIFFFFALFWIRPYALITAHKAGWLTRQLTIKQKPSKRKRTNSNFKHPRTPAFNH